MSFGHLSKVAGLIHLWGLSGLLTPSKMLTQAVRSRHSARSRKAGFREAKKLLEGYGGQSPPPSLRAAAALPGLCSCSLHLRLRGAVGAGSDVSAETATSQEESGEVQSTPVTGSPRPRHSVRCLRVRLTAAALHADEDGKVTGQAATRSSCGPDPDPTVPEQGHLRESVLPACWATVGSQCRFAVRQRSLSSAGTALRGWAVASVQPSHGPAGCCAWPMCRFSGRSPSFS